MASPTPNKGYTYPAHGGAVNAWDAPLNTNFDTIDKNFGGSLTTVLTTGATILSTTDAQNAVYIFTGALTGNCTVQWPTVGGTYVIDNQCTGAFTVTLQNAGGGATVVAPQGKRIEIYSAGNDMKSVVNAADGDWYVPGDLDVDGIITTPEVDTDVVKATNPYQLGGIPLVLGHGQCVFRITSSTVCTLFPKNGNTIAFPAGGLVQLPSGGVTLSNGGLSNGVVYYVYIVVAGTLSASTTGHTTDPATGIEVMIGDATQVLVGMVYLTGGSFLDSVTNRQVASWFNRSSKRGLNRFTVDRSTPAATGTLIEVNSEIRINFLSWGDAFSCAYNGTVTNNAGSGNTTSGILLDSVSTLLCLAQQGQLSGNVPFFCISSGSGLPSEGIHFISVAGASNPGTSTWSSSTNNVVGLSLVVTN